MLVFRKPHNHVAPVCATIQRNRIGLPVIRQEKLPRRRRELVSNFKDARFAVAGEDQRLEQPCRWVPREVGNLCDQFWHSIHGVSPAFTVFVQSPGFPLRNEIQSNFIDNVGACHNGL